MTTSHLGLFHNTCVVDTTSTTHDIIADLTIRRRSEYDIHIGGTQEVIARIDGERGMHKMTDWVTPDLSVPRVSPEAEAGLLLGSLWYWGKSHGEAVSETQLKKDKTDKVRYVTIESDGTCNEGVLDAPFRPESIIVLSFHIHHPPGLLLTHTQTARTQALMLMNRMKVWRVSKPFEASWLGVLLEEDV